MRQLTELGFRERIISDFLDFVNYSSLNQPQPPGDWLSSWLKEQRQLPVDDLAYAVEKYYFPSLEPVTRLRCSVEQDPLRICGDWSPTPWEIPRPFPPPAAPHWPCSHFTLRWATASSVDCVVVGVMSLAPFTVAPKSAACANGNFFSASPSLTPTPAGKPANLG